MAHDKKRSKLISRRAAVLGGINLGLFTTLAARMYYLQVLQADKFSLLAEQNRISLRLLPQTRGRIFDRDGSPLAVNQQNYRALLAPQQTDDLGDTLDALGRILNISDRDRTRILREAGRRAALVPVLVRENLSWEDVSRIEVNSPALPGVMIDVGQSRDYPRDDLAAHVLGYVSAVSEADLQESNSPELDLPGFRIGKAGVEKVYDLPLRGKVGTSQVEVNAIGRVIRELSREDGQVGADLHLTLDIGLQEYAHKQLGAAGSAAAVVIDVHSGEIIVMASTPSYDPNAFNRGLTSDEWHDLNANALAPLTNKAIAGQYPPGSTFKMMTALAALETGIATPDYRVFCPGQLQLGDATFHCWRHGGHGLLDLTGGLKNSCDVFFYETARRTGFEHVAEMARRFGMGSPTGIDLLNERPGLIPDRAWKERVLKQPWHPGETMINGIGQGYVLSTPLQLAVMAARIANDGKAVKPRIVRQVGTGAAIQGRPPQDWPGIGVSRNSLAAVRHGMNAVVNELGGTGYNYRIKDPNMMMAGKSGTAQVRHISERERQTGVLKDAQLPWKERDNTLFVAFAPVQAPRWAVAVCIEHGPGAGTIARDLMMETQKRFQETAELAPAAKVPGAPAPHVHADNEHDHDHAANPGTPA